MNPIVKQKWLKALRSGGYAQGRSALKTTKGYCCLGVLCDLAVREGIVTTSVSSYGVITFGIYEEDGLLPGEVQEWAGIATRSPQVKYVNKAVFEDDLNHLADINDRGSSFEEIANLIEAQL